MTAEPVTGAKPVGKFKSWLLAHRASSRIALILKLSTMVVSSILSLVWGRVFVHLLGRDVYGLLISFQGVLRMVFPRLGADGFKIRFRTHREKLCSKSLNGNEQLSGIAL